MNFKQTLTILSTITHVFLFAQTPLIDEEFDASTTIPAGWVSSSVGISTNNACTGSTNSAVFNGLNDALITPKLNDPQELKFLYLRSSNTTAWRMNVDYGFTTIGPWTNLGFVDNAINTDCLSFAVDLSSFTDIYIRFIDARGSGTNERYIDNVVVTQREVLGVSLLDFKATSISNAIKLEWSTANEKDNSHFIVEQSLDGKNFSKIAQIKGNGTTSENQNYSFLDDKNTNLTAYYRLKQVDFNGKTAFSKVISTKSEFRKGKTRVYPTLVNDWVTVDLNTTKDVELIVSDVIGRVILSKKIKNTEGGNSNFLDLNGIPNGMYFISVKSDFGIETFKIQKL
jgi:Secretion system C-terminal sorting domain